MSVTQLDLDRQAKAQIFTFGDASNAASLTLKDAGTHSNTVLTAEGSVSVGGDLTVTGNLKITGSIDEQSVTHLNVTDLTIRTNVGGTNPTDDTSGLTVEGTSAATKGAIYYNSGSATKFSIGDGTTQVDIVGRTSTQTLTNKTLTTPTISDFSNATHDHTNSAGGGQLSITGATTGTLSVARGGTGNTTQTAYALIAGGTTSTGALQQVSGLGTSGWVLTSNGAGALPSWQAVSASSVFQSTTVSGTQDSSNKSFTIGDALTSGTEMVFLNGQLLTSGSSNDYTLSSTTLSFSTGFTAPASTDVIQVFGQY